MPPHQVSFDNDFYMAIYETTAKQYATVWPSQSNLAPDNAYHQDEKQPRAYVPTLNIRGDGKYWPRDGHEVQNSPNRFIKLIRDIGGGSNSIFQPRRNGSSPAALVPRRCGTTTSRGTAPKVFS